MNHPEGMKTECFSTNLLTGSWISPYESSRILEISLLVVYGTSSFLALICYEGLLTLSVVENHSGLYNKTLSFMAYVFMVMGIDAMSSFLSAAILLCGVQRRLHRKSLKAAPGSLVVLFAMERRHVKYRMANDNSTNSYCVFMRIS
ncbi:hypothetical protein COOONC_09247 [Cooperia oncophora]